MFFNLCAAEFVETLIFTAMLLMATSAMAVIEVRYRRLTLLAATLRIPGLELQEFEILQKHNASLTIYDVPVKSTSAIFLVKVLFVQVIAFALTYAS